MITEKLREKLYDKLIRTAQARRVVTYSDIAPMLFLKMDNPVDRNTIGDILGEISRDEHEHGRPMLSAVVVHGEDKSPGGGFFVLAKELGRFVDGDKLVFYAKELNAVYDYWKSKSK
ncbi:MAG: hypothetical protein RBS89_07320 [Candidatus Delongbacteria bacterium]|nr:hypothetical protein [Candidatus Delongbacteria bacterium]